jgi:hypothetical protein
MKKLLAVCFVIAFAAPLGACLDGVTDAVEAIAGVGTTSILNDIDEGIEAGQIEAQSQVDEWVDEKQLAAGICTAAIVAECGGILDPASQATCYSNYACSP